VEEDRSPVREDTTLLSRPTRIREMPGTVGVWLNVVFGGALQAALLSVLASALQVIFFPLFAQLLMHGLPAALTDYLAGLAGFLVGSVFAGRRFPRFAFWRGGSAFLFGVLFDIVLVWGCGQTGSFLLDGADRLLILPFALFGALACGIACAAGSHLHRDLGAWLGLEFSEFCDSCRVTLSDKAAPEEESEEETEDDPPPAGR